MPAAGFTSRLKRGWNCVHQIIPGFPWCLGTHTNREFECGHGDVAWYRHKGTGKPQKGWGDAALPVFSMDIPILMWMAHIAMPAFTTLCLCSPLPHCGVGHPAPHSIHRLWEHPTLSAWNFVAFVLSQESLTQPQRERGCENSGSNLQSVSRLSGSRFNSQEGSVPG